MFKVKNALAVPAFLMAAQSASAAPFEKAISPQQALEVIYQQLENGPFKGRLCSVTIMEGSNIDSGKLVLRFSTRNHNEEGIERLTTTVTLDLNKRNYKARTYEVNNLKTTELVSEGGSSFGFSTKDGEEFFTLGMEKSNAYCVKE